MRLRYSSSVRRWAFWCIVLLIGGFESSRAGAVELRIQSGVSESGRLTRTWLGMIEGRHSQKTFDELTDSRGGFVKAEHEWFEFMIRNREQIADEFSKIAAVSPRGVSPSVVHLVCANRGGDDGFTWKASFIGLDLSSWVEAYGAPSARGNKARMLRILKHEFTHLVTKRYRESFSKDYSHNPWQRAIWTLYHEGLGTYWSLSTKWVSGDGILTEHARSALGRLEPLLRKRLAVLYQDDGSKEFELRKGISGGKFSERWGALTVALWISEEAKRDHIAFGKWLRAGPAAVEDLLDKKLQKGGASRSETNEK